MERLLKRSSSPAHPTELKPLDNYKRKTFRALLLGFAFIAAATLVGIITLKFTNSTLLSDQDQLYFILSSTAILLGMLGISLLEHYFSFDVANLAFNVLVIVGILVSDPPQELVQGRSLIALVLPVVLASVLLRPWAGVLVAAVFTIFIAVVHILLHLGLPNLPALLVLFLVALIIQQATSNLEQTLAKELKKSRSLVESQDRFQKVTESFPDAIFIFNLAGIITECNDPAVKMLGAASKLDILGRQGASLVHPEEQAKRAEFFSHLLSLGSFKETGFKGVRNDGSTFITDISAAIITDWQGNPSSYIFMLQDTSERMQVETALRESEEQYRRLIETLPIGVIVHQEGKIQLINLTGAKILGEATPDALIGRPNLEFVHPDYRELEQQHLSQSPENNGYGESVEEKLSHIDGTYFDAEVVTLPIKFKDKVSVLAMFQDITARKKVEAELRKSEENFRNLTENTADGILIGAPDGTHIYANRQACELLRYSPEEMLRTSQKDISDPTAYPKLRKNLQDRIAGRPLPKRYETILRRKDGSFFPVEISGTRTIWQDQTCDLVLFRDITEHRQIQEAIRVQNQRIQEVSRQLVDVQERERRLLASELHDDLGQSLTSLKLMLELASSYRSTHKQQKIIGESLNLITELMGKVRNLSLDLRPAMLDDFGLFTALRWLFERFQVQTGIMVLCNFDLDSDRRFFSEIETAVFRIIQEALTNIARHAGVQKAQVNLEIGATFSIEIVDQGTGFGTLQEGQNQANSVGLSGMQERARLLGGHVDIVSEKGVGTRVIASIPLAGDGQ